MSFSTIKRSVVWLDTERKMAKEEQKENQPRDLNSPDPWIELRSEASSEDYDGKTLSSVSRYTWASSAPSLATPPMLLERAAGYDLGRKPNYESRLSVPEEEDSLSATEKSSA